MDSGLWISMAYSCSTILISFNTCIGFVASAFITGILFGIISKIKAKISTHSQSSSIPSANRAPPIDIPPIQVPGPQVEEVKMSEPSHSDREEREKYCKVVDHTQIQVQVTQSSHFVSNELFVWTTSDQRGSECSSSEILCMSSTKTASSIGCERESELTNLKDSTNIKNKCSCRPRSLTLWTTFKYDCNQNKPSEKCNELFL